MKEYLTMDETAEYLSLHYQTVKKMAAANEIPFYVVKGRKRFAVRHLEGWMAKRFIPQNKGF